MSQVNPLPLSMSALLADRPTAQRALQGVSFFATDTLNLYVCCESSIGVFAWAEIPIGVPNLKGRTTLVAGVSPAPISAPGLAAGSVIIPSLYTPNTSANTGKYSALSTDRVLGAAGTFLVTAILKTGDTINVADISTLDWLVVF